MYGNDVNNHYLRVIYSKYFESHNMYKFIAHKITSPKISAFILKKPFDFGWIFTLSTVDMYT